MIKLTTLVGVAAVLAWSPAVLAAAPEQPALELAKLERDRKCKKPKTTLKLLYGKEKVIYGFEDAPEAKAGSGRKLLGLFWANHGVGYEASLEANCVKSLAMELKVEPNIALKASLKKKVNWCIRKSALSHERGHAKVAKTHYKKLAKTIKNAAAKLFTGRRVPDFNTLATELDKKLNGVMVKFRKRYSAAQDEFHGKLSRAEIVRKKCGLVKRN
jgi:hypothetical protein